MLEIYNEQVRDLLSKNNPKGGLPIRQNPKLGIFYVQDLKKVPVGSYKEIEQRIEQGTGHGRRMFTTRYRKITVKCVCYSRREVIEELFPCFCFKKFRHLFE